jgi:ActD protein
MSRMIMLGIFEDEEAILGAACAARDQGLRVVEAYTPYAVHGLDRALGLKPSRLSLVCLIAGATGAIVKLWFEIWTAALDWPINVGGKPWNSLPAFVPITFEVMVLFAGLATVAAFILVSRLRPGKQAQLVAPGITNDRFALVLEETDAAFDAGRVRRLLEQHGAVEIAESVSEEVPA